MKCAVDAEEVILLLDPLGITEHDAGKGVFNRVFSVDENRIPLFDLREIYRLDKDNVDPRVVLVDLQEIFGKIHEREIISRISAMYNHFDQFEKGINKRFWSFLICMPENVEKIEAGDVSLLPWIIRTSGRFNEIWGAFVANDELYLLIDLKKLVIQKITEVFS